MCRDSCKLRSSDLSVDLAAIAQPRYALGPAFPLMVVHAAHMHVLHMTGIALSRHGWPITHLITLFPYVLLLLLHNDVNFINRFLTAETSVHNLILPASSDFFALFHTLSRPRTSIAELRDGQLAQWASAFNLLYPVLDTLKTEYMAAAVKLSLVGRLFLEAD